jgi:hypothetical protein
MNRFDQIGFPLGRLLVEFRLGGEIRSKGERRQSHTRKPADRGEQEADVLTWGLSLCPGLSNQFQLKPFRVIVKGQES